MAHDRSEVHLAADLSAALSAEPARALESGAFRIAVFGSFSGRAGSSAPGGRRSWRVDRDDVDAVMSRIAPALQLVVDPNEAPVSITFSSLDDFHPDQLLRRLPLFQSLMALRSGSAPAAAPQQAVPRRRTEEPDSVALDLSTGSLLDQIVGNAPPAAGGARSQPSSRDDLAEFVARAVRSHTVAESTPQQRDLAARVDDVITAMMRVVLHHPQFQALESLWRAVDFLVRRLDTSESMQVYLVDVARDELVADLAGADLVRSTTNRLLRDSTGEAAAWSLVVGAYTFDPGDAEVLTKLAALGRAAGTPWLASAHPRFVGVETFANTDSDDWTTVRSAAWSELRGSPSAAFLSLSAPRFLARLPYGRRGEQCDAFRFEELGDGAPDHASFLWASSAFLSALAIAEGIAADGAPASHATIDNFPLYVAPIDGEPTATPCAEAVLTQRGVEEMLDVGLTALTSPRDGDSIVIPRIQSVAMPPRPVSVRVPTA